MKRDRVLTDAERHMVVAALRLGAAQALQVASCWEPDGGVIPRAIGKEVAGAMHRKMLESAQEHDRLATAIAECGSVWLVRTGGNGHGR